MASFSSTANKHDGYKSMLHQPDILTMINNLKKRTNIGLCRTCFRQTLSFFVWFQSCCYENLAILSWLCFNLVYFLNKILIKNLIDSWQLISHEIWSKILEKIKCNIYLDLFEAIDCGELTGNIHIEHHNFIQLSYCAQSNEFQT